MKKNLFYTFKFPAHLIFLTLFFSIAIFAQEEVLDPLAETKKFMQDSKQRNEFINTNSNAKKADEFSDIAVGNDRNKKEQLYHISAEALETLIKNGPKDESLQQKILRAQQNPEKFYNELPSDLKNQIRNLANEVENSKIKPSKKP